MAFENDTNAGRVQKMVESLALIQKSALSNRADADALKTMMRPLMEALTTAGLVGAPVHAPEDQDTPRKRAALRRKQQREWDALPLFAEQIAEEQPTEDEEMGRRAILSDTQEARWRSTRAAEWRKARRMIDSLPAEEGRAIRRVWDCAPYPADPSRLLGVLHSYSLGKLDLKRPPFPLSKTDAGGSRIAKLFAKPDLFVTILKARDIAEDPDSHPLAERHAAYHHLQAAASKNKDRKRAMQDRVLASDLFLRLGELEETDA